MRKCLIFIALSLSLKAQIKKETEVIEGKVIWPTNYILEIYKPSVKMTDGKLYLATVVQNLVNDELSLQRSIVTRGKVIPVSIEYPVHLTHENLPTGERARLLERDQMPEILPLKIVRALEVTSEKLACSNKLKSDQYALFSRVSGSVGALQIDILLCHGGDLIYKQTTVTDEQMLVVAVNRLMNPLRAKLTGNVYASLKIDSTPPRTSVYIDGQFIGKTPLAYSYLIPGTYKLALKKDGYGAIEEEIQAKAGETLKRDLNLNTALAGGVLDVTTEPAGARIYLDADFKGVTPNKVENISLGTYRLHLLHPEKGEKYISVSFTEKNPTVAVSETLSEFNLTRVPGMLGLSYKTWYWVSLGAAAASMGAGIGYYVWRDQAKEDIQARVGGKSSAQFTTEDSAFIVEKNSEYETRDGMATAFMVSAGLLGVVAIYFYVKHLLSADEGMVRARPRDEESVAIGYGSTSAGQQIFSLNLRF